VNGGGGSILYVVPSRAEDVRNAVAGYEATGVPLVAFDGTSFTPAGASNDVGMFYFIPKISAAFGLDAAFATEVFLLLILLGGLISGAVASWVLFSHWYSRAVALVALTLLGVVAAFMGDQYLIAPAVTAGLMLPFLYVHRCNLGDTPTGVFLLIVGVVAGLGHVTRAHAATAVVLAIATVIVCSRGRSLARRGLLLLPLLIGSTAAPLLFKQVVARREAFLSAQRADYQPVYAAHPFWHSVYIGFGFLSNPYVPAYRDEVAIARVNAVAPGTPYVSREYERVLRSEVFRLVRDRPALVVGTLFAKLGVVLLHLVIFANAGLIAALRRRNPPPVEAAFWVALGFSALQGLLVMPWPGYLSGFIAFAALYGVVTLNGLLELERHPAAAPAPVLQPAAVR
jgi:hypothetical protein